jgi:hypothetical protein
MHGHLRTLLERYAERYLAGDADAIADMCDVPFIAVRGGVPIHLLDRGALVEHFAANIAGYRAARAATAEIAHLDVLAQGEGAALATVSWHVIGVDGGTIREFRTSYQLAGIDDWVILAYVNHDPVVRDATG